MFKIYDCDIGIKYKGQNYDFEHVNEITIDDPKMTKITRGNNQKNLEGLTYTEGGNEPEKWEIPIMNMPIELKAVLDAAYIAKDRMDVYCVARANGAKKTANNAILCAKPQQLQVSDTAESLAVKLTFMSFDTAEVLKP